MKVFVDLHHFDLYYSLQLLFEDRLGWELYRPIGMDWKTEGFWAQHGHQDEVAECYLSTEDGRCAELLSRYDTLAGKSWAIYSLHLPRIGSIYDNLDGTFLIEDKSKVNCYQRGITLEAFKEMEFDIVISSVPIHAETFDRLVKEHQPTARHIFHMGNRWPIPSNVRNVMSSSPVDTTCHSIMYHQEFDLDVFRYQEPVDSHDITSYVYFPESAQLFKEIEQHLSGIQCNFVGNIQGHKDDIVLTSQDLATRFHKSLFTWLIKPGGEGFGHVLFNSYACGRPAIIRRSDYKNLAGDSLLEDGVTCIFIDNRNATELSSVIQRLIDSNKHEDMCRAAYQRFCEVVNFDNEFVNIERFLGELK